MEKDGVKVGCVVSGAIEKKPHGVVLPSPRLLPAEVSVEVAVPVPMFMSPPDSERSPPAPMLVFTWRRNLGSIVPMPTLPSLFILIFSTIPPTEFATENER